MRLPNLILAGAPKCGTSSLFTWLVAHPEVCGSSPKEPYYFMDINHPLLDPNANYLDHGLDRYNSFFQDCSSQAKVIVEATAHYMYQETALNFFASCQPQPYVIFLLRKPSRMVFSTFSYLQNNHALMDKELSFIQFTEFLLEDKFEKIQDHCHSEISFLWLKNQLIYGQYYHFIKQWLELFSPHKLRVLLFEQMIENPQNTLLAIARDVGIDPDFYNRFYFESKNKTITIKNLRMHEKLVKAASYLPDGAFRAGLKAFYYRLNTSSPKPEDKALSLLDHYFSPFNQQLAHAFNFDLKSWG